MANIPYNKLETDKKLWLFLDTLLSVKRIANVERVSVRCRTYVFCGNEGDAGSSVQYGVKVDAVYGDGSKFPHSFWVCVAKTEEGSQILKPEMLLARESARQVLAQVRDHLKEIIGSDYIEDSENVSIY